METVTDFIFLGSKITTNGDCSHEIKRCLLFGRKAMTNLDNVLKSRDITLLIKVSIVKAMVFLVVWFSSRRRMERQRMGWLDSITDSVDMSLSNLQEIVEDRKPDVLPSMVSQGWIRPNYWMTTTEWLKVTGGYLGKEGVMRASSQICKSFFKSLADCENIGPDSKDYQQKS